MKKKILPLVAALMFTGAYAQTPGDLDVSFGIGGYTMTDSYSNTGEVYWDMITLSDDKIIKVGFADDGGDKDVLIAKFLADGTPDSSFGSNGFATFDLSSGLDEDARGVHVLLGGQLLITGHIETPGSLDGYVARINEDGTLDNSFGTSVGYTKFNTGDNLVAYGRSVVSIGSEIFIGGAVLVGGQYDIVIANFTQSGGLDNTFSSGGYATYDVRGESDNLTAMDVKSNGEFVFGGSADSAGVQLGFVGSLTQFGTPSTFGVAGSYTFDMGSGLNEVNDLYVDANDNIVLAGDEGAFPDVNGVVSRLTPAGVLDNTFGVMGTLMSDPGLTTALFFRGVMETADGGVVAVGNFGGLSNDVYAMLLTSDGLPNGVFGGNGDVVVPFAIATVSVVASAGALQSDGSIIIGGYLTSQDFVGSNMFMLRLHPEVDDTSIDELNKVVVSVYPNPSSNQFAITADKNVESVQLISLSGTVIESWTAQTAYQIPSSVVSGTYLVRVNTAAGVAFERLVIIK